MGRAPVFPHCTGKAEDRRQKNSFPAEEDEGVGITPSPPFYGGGTPLIKPILILLIHSRSIWPCPRTEALSTLVYSKDQCTSTDSILTPWREQGPPENSGCSDQPAPSCSSEVHFAPQDNMASGHTSKHCLMRMLAMSHLRAGLASSWHEKKSLKKSNTQAAHKTTQSE